MDIVVIQLFTRSIFRNMINIYENRKIQHFNVSVIASTSNYIYIYILYLYLKDLCNKEIDCLLKIIKKH